ncbi:hypothetical protein Ancab_033048 [Ancistrocladus abbreviatus]
MANDGDLWDDSVLINAFDQAMSEYKRTHINSFVEYSADTGEVKINQGGVSTTTIESSQEAKSHMERDENSTLGSSLAAETGQDMFQSCSNSQGFEDYNELCRQYYMLEEQRQKILQKLQQFGSWNHSCLADSSCSCMQWGHQSSTSQDSRQNILVSCCPYVCQSSVAPCFKVPSCSLDWVCAGASCTDPTVAMGVGKQSMLADFDILKTAMGAAERAMSSLKENTSDGKGENDHNDELEQNASSGTDLTVVLNAWYSAGFYTGKYLSEQSHAKKRHT